ncbi:uncharacterized protein LOC131073141 [Cryptomeria japonica]|uniref:uncharacterized protein LOC131073141 n=1 Tax=Cryptomeria japonica TaxID=3369 RepID=UPI0027DA060D|nr:uncharacterized protein LOC131073141 [Cryptomeria japonica]
MDSVKFALKLKLRLKELLKVLVKRRKWLGNTVSVGLGLLMVLVMVLAFIRSHRNHCRGAAIEGEAEPSSFPWNPLDYPHKNESLSTGELNSKASLSLGNIIFVIQGSSKEWSRRKEFVKLWFRPGVMRGFVWMEENVPVESDDDQFLPPILVSDDSYALGIRLSMILLNTFRLRPPGAQWFVLCEDDTIFSTKNLMSVLAKYDSTDLVYIGGNSESHHENHGHAHAMAFSGAGIAISYGLAEALSIMLEACLERYPQVRRNDNRLHACITELGVPITREQGFHQFDIRGDAFGLLSAHPLTPFVSMHHVDQLQPVFPNHNSLDSLRTFMSAMETEPASFLQQAISYNHTEKLSFSISLGYVVQVFPSIMFPRELQDPQITFRAWDWGDHPGEFSMNSRIYPQSPCNRPFLFYLKENFFDKEKDKILNIYERYLMVDEHKAEHNCRFHSFSPKEVQKIHVMHKPFEQRWHLIPRRLCCNMRGKKDGVLTISLDKCKRGQRIYS